MPDPSTYQISQGLFLKALALCYLIAFTSLKVQVKGLYGSGGIQPIADLLKSLNLRYKTNSIYWQLPTVFWFSATNRSLITVCYLGIGLSLLAFFGIVPAIALFLLWIFYYSFVAVGSPFLNYQWDVLLLEVGFVGALFAIQSPPSFSFILLLWFLLFRLMFSSGIIKLLYGSKEWQNLTAMDYHYETQPLPTRAAYYCHQQPKYLSKLSTLGVYFFEIAVPLGIFGPTFLHIFVFYAFVFFHTLLMITGNFAFFNLLTLSLCIPLLPDSYIQSFKFFALFTPLVGENVAMHLFLSLVAGLFLLLNSIECLTIFFPLGRIYHLVIPFRHYNLINPYGLFVHMTTKRDEIIIEGSHDGKDWKPYIFKWKPQDLKTAPKIVAPHQPRLDWQMWFSALTSYQANSWFAKFLYCLLEGREDVSRLLKVNPFPENPPKYVRALLYRYRFTDLKTKWETGKWWTKELIGEHSPVLHL